ncbi:MAG: hypothetical protein CME63_01420 [Halobacteriovoraceae bacterium]|nr:hypothetical protein [Halobacteriovoraceae bacterium]
MEGKTIVVWFSCGAASAVALSKTIEKYGEKNNIIACNNPIDEEDRDNQRFLKEVAKYLGVKIHFVRSKNYPFQSCKDVWEYRRFMSGPYGAPCTQELKKRARQDWEKANPHDYIVLGFTAEEKNRHERFILSEKDNLLPILIQESITKKDCYRIVDSWGIELPRIYKLGYPNANCIGCVKASGVSYWQLVRKQHPEIFKERCEQSRRIGAKLVKYKKNRIFLDELPIDAKGRKLKNLDFECGLFCEEGGL